MTLREQYGTFENLWAYLKPVEITERMLILRVEIFQIPGETRWHANCAQDLSAPRKVTRCNRGNLNFTCWQHESTHAKTLNTQAGFVFRYRIPTLRKRVRFLCSTKKFHQRIITSIRTGLLEIHTQAGPKKIGRQKQRVKFAQYCVPRRSFIRG